MTVNAVNTYIVPTTANEVTMPLQPSFCVFNDTLRTNVTGDSTVYTVQFNDDSGGGFFDQNADFNTGTYTFTAPVTGIYLFTATVTATQIAGGHTDGTLYFNINAGGWNGDVKNPANCVQAAGLLSFNSDLIVNLTAADTVTVLFVVHNGAKAVDVVAGNETRFSGALIA